jgi:hypothetical protein
MNLNIIHFLESIKDAVISLGDLRNKIETEVMKAEYYAEQHPTEIVEAKYYQGKLEALQMRIMMPSIITHWVDDPEELEINKLLVTILQKLGVIKP